MNTEISHLTVSATALLGEADNQRIRAIRSRRWLIYPRAKQVLDRLNLLVDHPRGTRMPVASHLWRQRYGQDHDHEALP